MDAALTVPDRSYPLSAEVLVLISYSFFYNVLFLVLLSNQAIFASDMNISAFFIGISTANIL